LGDVVRAAQRHLVAPASLRYPDGPAWAVRSIVLDVLGEFLTRATDQSGPDTKRAIRDVRTFARSQIHRELVDQLRPDGFVQDIGSTELRRRTVRRKVETSQVNVLIKGIGRDGYEQRFGELLNLSGRAWLFAGARSLRDDCAALNILFAKGRRAGSKESAPRRRGAR
jgi:hypothetical protein